MRMIMTQYQYMDTSLCPSEKAHRLQSQITTPGQCRHSPMVPPDQEQLQIDTKCTTKYTNKQYLIRYKHDSLSDVTGVNPTTPEPPSTSKLDHDVETEPVSNIPIVPSPPNIPDDTDISGQVNMTETDKDKDTTKQAEEPGNVTV